MDRLTHGHPKDRINQFSRQKFSNFFLDDFMDFSVNPPPLMIELKNVNEWRSIHLGVKSFEIMTEACIPLNMHTRDAKLTSLSSTYGLALLHERRFFDLVLCLLGLFLDEWKRLVSLVRGAPYPLHLTLPFSTTVRWNRRSIE
ncbi:hypothetical protein Tco_0047134 [Tanacetum coccineum]